MDTACVMKPQEMGNTAGNVSTYECVLHTVVSRADRSKGSGFQKACYKLSHVSNTVFLERSSLLVNTLRKVNVAVLKLDC